MKISKRYILRNLSNIHGWSSKQKILVIESDDWGSVRMPSKEVFDRLARKGLDLESGDAERYNRNDTLANADDLNALFETLLLFNDKNGRPPVFTAVSTVANPDFDRIRKSGFKDYYYEPFPETLRKYRGREGVFEMWRQGLSNGLFVPQFHGREHLNIRVWMRSLQSNDKETHLAFDEEMWGFRNKHVYGISFQAAFDIENPDDIDAQHYIIKDGLLLFKNLFGYRASYFVPPNGPFNNCLEESAFNSGIKYMCAPKLQVEPLGKGKGKYAYHYIGQQNRHAQVYITRNCLFEPSRPGIDWVSQCFNDIQIAFNWNKPAVISTHRVNYIGAINEGNRKVGLQCLKSLLQKVVNKWPDVEFMTSAELGALISSHTRVK